MKWIIAFVAGAVGFVTMVNVASVDPVSNHDDISIEQKQKRFDKIAQGFEAGFKMTAGSKAEIMQKYVDAETDLISFSVKLLDPKINDVPYEHVEKQRLKMLEQVCKLTAKKKLLETDFTMRVRYFKPEGGKLMTLQVDARNCGPYIA